MIYKVLNPVMFTHFLTNLGFVELARLLFGGDDPDDAVKNSFISIAEAIFLSGFKAYGIAGFAASIIIESVIASFDDNFAHFKTSIPILTELEETVNNLLKGDLDFWDYVDAAAFCADTAVGISAQKAVKTYHGFEDLLNGEYGIGASEIFGWGRYTSTKAWTGKEPDKKRKKKKRSNKEIVKEKEL